MKIQPYMKSSLILKQAANFYSEKLYSFFEEEFIHDLGGLCIDHSSPDSSKFSIKNIDQSFDSHKWTVLFNSSEGTIQCSCAKFEMMGLLCSHCMRVMRQLDVINIPQKYLIPRWSSSAHKDLYSGLKIQHMRNNTCTSIQESQNIIFRNYICRFSYQISTEAQGNEEAE
ncbi:Protein FAR1-RELATED SEQUENCE 12 [Dendrobium catenatum]|uniref:Protein FAR1-RELATED SEQUENCE n=1 Tax=Dendrobium catenatum TaxID=906689 RepID=A0A2I0VJS1_9ASPA|nr:Protein FAR1-RELATED SEQUENCE 12 [Dendrobium catenatum]